MRFESKVTCCVRYLEVDDRKAEKRVDLDKEEAEGSSTEGSHHGDDTSLATEGDSSVVVIRGSGGAGLGIVESAAGLGLGSVDLGLGGADSGAVLLLHIGGLLAGPALGVTALAGGPLVGFGGVALDPVLRVGTAGLGLGPGLDVVGDVATEDSGGGDLRGSGVLSGDEAGGSENGDLGDEHDEGCLLLLW
jgi:hypothetical protein